MKLKLIPRMPLALCVKRTPTATMQSQVVRSAAVALRGQMGTCRAGIRCAGINMNQRDLHRLQITNFLCSLDSGQCNCADRVEGRQCDHCVWGAWNYPTCEACTCDTKGTTEKICDQVSPESVSYQCIKCETSGNIGVSLQAQCGGW